jgi:hypothetical protein
MKKINNTEAKKMSKAERKKYFKDNYDEYVYNAPIDPRDIPQYDSYAEIYDKYGTMYMTNEMR